MTSTYQPNFGTLFVRLKPWDERKGEALHVRGVMARLQAQFARIPEAIIFPFNIPTISGFGASAGFNFLLQDRSGSLTRRAARRAEPDVPSTRRASGPRSATSSPRSTRAIRRSRSTSTARRRASSASRSTRRSRRWRRAWAGRYVNDFNRFGRLFRVYVQAEADYRRKPEDIGEI